MKRPELMSKPRDFNSIEQALLHALNGLSDDDLQDTKKKKKDLTRYSDPEKPDRNLSHRDAIDIDNACIKKNLGHPLLDVHEAQIAKAIHEHAKDKKEFLSPYLVHLGGRIGKLMDAGSDAEDPNSPGGKELTKAEKEKIYKALKEVKAKITELELKIK